MKQLVFAINLAVLLTSCVPGQKENIPSAAIGGHASLITGKWKRIAATSQIKGQPEEEIWGNKLPCDKDDWYIFNTDFTYGTDQGPLKCNPADPQYQSKTTWRTEGKFLYIIQSEDEGGFEFWYEIVELSASRLKVRRELDKWILTETYSR